MASDLAAESFDEAYDEKGSPRRGYAELFDRLAEVNLGELRTAVAQLLEQRRVGFGEERFVVDPIPRLLCADEWSDLVAGLAQRTRALNLFLRDAYGEQQIVSAGILDADTLNHAEGFEPDLLGRLPQLGSPVGVAGFDVVRAPDGEFLVLEDNLRTPSGYSYAVAARKALTELLPPGPPTPRPVDPLAYDLLGSALRAAVPAQGGALEGNPLIVVLTDGPANVAYYEHREAALHLDAPLVTLSDLIADGDRVRVRLSGGAEHDVDVVYRRCDEDRVRDERGELTDVARLLLPAWLGGRMGLANAFGNGLADDKLVHSHVEDFVRFYLDETPLIRSVPTQALDTPTERLQAVGRLRDLVVKPRHGHGGKGVVIGAHAEEDDLDELADELERSPGQYISQPLVALSSHPTVVDGRLEPRHVDLRPFAFCGEGVTLLPGGLTRVALEAGTLVVNSSQNGGGKDTWVID